MKIFSRWRSFYTVKVFPLLHLIIAFACLPLPLLSDPLFCSHSDVSPFLTLSSWESGCSRLCCWMAIGGGRGTESAPSSPSSSPQLCMPEELDLDNVPLDKPSLRTLCNTPEVELTSQYFIEREWHWDCSPAFTPTSSTVSSWGVAALSSESFWEPIVISPLFRTSRLFLCLCASFFTWPSALPLLSRRTGLVSHFRRVLPRKQAQQTKLRRLLKASQWNNRGMLNDNHLF